MQLRWVAVVGQWLAVGITHWGLGIKLPLTPLIVLIAVTASSNLICNYLVSIAKKNWSRKFVNMISQKMNSSR